MSTLTLSAMPCGSAAIAYTLLSLTTTGSTPMVATEATSGSFATLSATVTGNWD